MKVTDVRSKEFRCYTTQTNPYVQIAKVRAGTEIGIKANGPMYHKGVSRSDVFLSTDVPD